MDLTEEPVGVIVGWICCEPKLHLSKDFLVEYKVDSDGLELVKLFFDGSNFDPRSFFEVQICLKDVFCIGCDRTSDQVFHLLKADSGSLSFPAAESHQWNCQDKDRNP